MAHIRVVEAVRARLGAGFDGCPIYLESQYDPPKQATPYLVVQFPYSTAMQASVGSPGDNLYREEGVVRIVLHVVRKGGIPEGREWADQIASLFRGKQFEGVRTWAPTSPVSDDSNDTSSYFLLAFVIPYLFDIRE